MKREPPTLDQIRATFDSERARHPAWPAMFEAAMADPLTAGVLGALTRACATTRPAPSSTVYSQPGLYHQSRYQGRRPVVLDFKSRAAGEREEN